MAGAEGDGDLVRRVRHGGLQEQRAGDAEGVFPVADDADVSGPVQRHGEREVAGRSESVLVEFPLLVFSPATNVVAWFCNCSNRWAIGATSAA
jgi:hypothetical protein